MMNYHSLKVVAVIFSYCSVSIILVFANKLLVGSKTSSTDVSLFVLWVQCLMVVIVAISINVCKAIWNKNLDHMKIKRGQLWAFPVLRMNCTLVSMLAFNNICLRYVDIAFYQVARSLTIIFVVILSFTVLKKNISCRVVFCCVVIAGGYFLGVDQEQILGTLSLKGVVCGVLSSLFVALNGIFTTQALDSVEHNSYNLAFYGNLNASVLFVPIVYLSGQFGDAARAMPHWTTTYWTLLFTTGVLCFSISWLWNIQINLTSPLTHTIIANSKSLLQTVLAVLYFHETKSLLWWISVFMVVGGACAYTITKIKEEEKAKKVPLNVTSGEEEQQID